MLLTVCRCQRPAVVLSHLSQTRKPRKLRKSKSYKKCKQLCADWVLSVIQLEVGCGEEKGAEGYCGRIGTTSAASASAWVLLRLYSVVPWIPVSHTEIVGPKTCSTMIATLKHVVATLKLWLLQHYLSHQYSLCDCVSQYAVTVCDIILCHASILRFAQLFSTVLFRHFPISKSRGTMIGQPMSLLCPSGDWLSALTCCGWHVALWLATYFNLRPVYWTLSFCYSKFCWDWTPVSPI